MQSQRITKNLGLNTVSIQDELYSEIKSSTAKCLNKNHEGERILPIRDFYLNKKRGLQSACIICQKNLRKNRIKLCREKFKNKTKQEIYNIYIATYGQTKSCSKCKISKTPSEFFISISMECGLHNHCISCSIIYSKNNNLRCYIFMPDKDGIEYKKKEKCERCNGTYKLAVDHILPIAKGGNDCISNKQTLCIHCNSKKSDTIDCFIKPDFLSDRYKDDSLDFTKISNLSTILSKKVYAFRQMHIDNSTLEEIRTAVIDYRKKYNLHNNVDRIVRKIATIFNKI